MITDAYEDRKKNETMKETWGHLRQDKDGLYTGWIEVSYDGYGQYGLFDWEVKDIVSNPFYDTYLEHWTNQIVEGDSYMKISEKGLYRINVRLEIKDMDIVSSLYYGPLQKYKL